MFGLREKLALSYAALLVVVIAMGFQSVRQLMILKTTVDNVVEDNIYTAEAADNMRIALGALHTGLSASMLGRPDLGDVRLSQGKERFENSLQECRRLANNDAERMFTASMETYYQELVMLIEEILSDATAPETRVDIYVEEVQPLMTNIRETAVNQQAVNRREMTLRNDATGAQISDAQWQTAAVLSAALLVALAAIYFSGRWVLVPILKLTVAADQVRQGNYAVEVPPASQDELGTLALTFNRMSQELNEMHQLRTAEFMRVQRSRERVLEHLDDAIALVSPEGKIETGTKVAAEVFGLESGKHVREAVYPWVENLYVAALDCEDIAVLDGQDSAIQVFVNGEEHFFYPQGICIRNDDKSVSAILLLIRDITQLRLQEELKRDAVSTVSHQLKTPLTSIRMALLLLKERKFGELNVQQADLLDTAAEESDRLFRMVQGLLDMSRIKSGRVMLECEAIPADELLAASVEPLRGQAEVNMISLQVNAGFELPNVWVDPARVEHVFTNLVSNAIKYSPPGAHVYITVRPETQWVRYDVEDTGPGIPEEYLDNIFEQFFRVPGQDGVSGAGLGLAIVKQIVEAHGGRIEARNREAKGARFSVWLPKADSVEALGLRPSGRVLRA